MGACLRRKCFCCKKMMYITYKTIDNVIYYDKHSYHSRCFIRLCKNRALEEKERKNIGKKWTKILDNIDELKLQSHEFYDDELKRDEVLRFIKEKYHVPIVSSFVLAKLNKLYDGTYHGLLGKKIPPEHLLDMWKRQMQFLNSIQRKNNANDKYMYDDRRILYDLSILVNKYNSYLDWLNRQKIVEADLMREKRRKEYDEIRQKASEYEKLKKKNIDSFSGQVDDMFG